MTAYLQEMTYEDFQKEREEIIGATAEDIRGLRGLLASVLDDDAICVIGSEEMLKNNEKMFLYLENLC